MNKTLIFICAVILFFDMVGTGNSPLITGGFETDDFTGWSEYIPPGGFATVETNCTTTDPDGIVTFYPLEGDDFALLKTDG